MTEEVKTLLVRIAATTELLRSNLIAAEREIAKFDATTSAVTDRVDRNFRKVGQSAAAQRAGLQQLSFQLNDVATMYAMGARPMQIFASQSGQILQAVQLATGGTSRLAAFLGGPWGIALTSAAVVLTPFIAKLFETSDAADTATNALEALAKKRADALAQQFQLREAEKGLNELLKQRDQIYRGMDTNGGFGSVARFGEVGRGASDSSAKLAEINRKIADARAAIDRERVVRAMGESAAAIPNSGYRTARVSGASTTSSGGGGRGSVPRIKPDRDISPEIAFRAEMLRYTEAQAQAMALVRDRDYEQQIELINRKAEYEFEARREVLERLRQQEARQIDFLASMFEDAFRGGTNAIWRNFKNIGLAVIAQVMAQFAIARFTGKGGFNLGDAFSIGLTKVLGFADGGRPPVGRVSVVGERGPELFVPDAAGTIIPNHALGGGGVSLTINAPGATAETVSMIRREIANATPALVAAASGNTVRALNRKSL